MQEIYQEKSNRLSSQKGKVENIRQAHHLMAISKMKKNKNLRKKKEK